MLQVDVVILDIPDFEFAVEHALRVSQLLLEAPIAEVASLVVQDPLALVDEVSRNLGPMILPGEALFTTRGVRVIVEERQSC